MFDVYTPIYGFDISTSDQSLYLISTSSIQSQYDCYHKCTALKNCKMVSIKSNQCSLFSQIKYSVASNALNTSPCLFEKFEPDFSTITPYLLHYWPFNNNLNSSISFCRWASQSVILVRISEMDFISFKTCSGVRPFSTSCEF